ncbi:M67 family metallopeptidase [Aurantiacibacter spongiae]|uniref:M67 family peptidase n=1 Tax=Aurantiacibacter spongiae TaxID=2488860 RepID=A0A3N5DS02_9SPHN|nr:M67 family metallopeptidase [Aurantiacibacter spongiae]RPF71961.1 M67 family peptidase [Aurantiacibacter spongiae]
MGQTGLHIARSVLDKIAAHAAREHPRECCGILTGSGMDVTGTLPAGNVHSSPETHFEIDPQALIDAHRATRSGGPDVLGYYHSHPHGPARPSPTDARMAAGDGRIWAIATRGEVTCWRDDESGFLALPYIVTGA